MPRSDLTHMDRVSATRWWRVLAAVTLAIIVTTNSALIVVALTSEHGTGRDVMLGIAGALVAVAAILLVRLWRGAILRRSRESPLEGSE